MKEEDIVVGEGRGERGRRVCAPRPVNSGWALDHKSGTWLHPLTGAIAPF